MRDFTLDVKDWLHRLYSRGEAHGSQLQEALGRPRDGRSGSFCNETDAMRELDRLEKAGWIVRGSYEQSSSQRFFGVGGRTPGVKAAKGAGYSTEHWYTPAADLDQKLKSSGLW